MIRPVKAANMNGRTRWAVDSRNMTIIVIRMILFTPFLGELLNVDIHMMNNVKYIPEGEQERRQCQPMSCCRTTGPDMLTIKYRLKYGPEQMALSDVHHGWDSRGGGQEERSSNPAVFSGDPLVFKNQVS